VEAAIVRALPPLRIPKRETNFDLFMPAPSSSHPNRGAGRT
jgi:hypothetical protein